MTGIAIKRESEEMGHHHEMGSYSSVARERRKVRIFFCIQILF